MILASHERRVRLSGRQLERDGAVAVGGPVWFDLSGRGWTVEPHLLLPVHADADRLLLRNRRAPDLLPLRHRDPVGGDVRGVRDRRVGTKRKPFIKS